MIVANLIVQQMHWISLMATTNVVQVHVRVVKMKETATVIQTAGGPSYAVTVTVRGETGTVTTIVARLLGAARLEGAAQTVVTTGRDGAMAPNHNALHVMVLGML
jgi:hypothetical protein